MKVMIVGTGPRERALADKLQLSPSLEKLFRWPSHGKMLRPGEGIGLSDGAPITDVARRAAALGIELVVLASDEAITSGLGNVLETHRIPCFGPTRVAAHFQWDPTSVDQLLRTGSVRSAQQSIAHTLDECVEVATGYVRNTGGAIIRGVVPDHAKLKRICTSTTEVLRFAGEIDAQLRETGSNPLFTISECVEGPHAAFVVCVGPRAVVPIGFLSNWDAESAYAPVASLPRGAERLVVSGVVSPLLAELRASGTPYTGFLSVEICWVDRVPVVTDIACLPDDLGMGVLTIADGRDWLKVIRYVTGIHALASADVLATELKAAVAISWRDASGSEDELVTIAEPGATIAAAWDACFRRSQSLRPQAARAVGRLTSGSAR